MPEDIKEKNVRKKSPEPKKKKNEYIIKKNITNKERRFQRCQYPFPNPPS